MEWRIQLKYHKHFFVFCNNFLLLDVGPTLNRYIASIRVTLSTTNEFLRPEHFDVSGTKYAFTKQFTFP